MKKMFSLTLALIMALALCVPTMAAEQDNSVNAADSTTGSITVTNPVEGETYNLYRLLDLESYNKDTGAYAYKLNDKWDEFFEQDTIKDVYVNIDAQEYVTWVDGASAPAFAKLALAYAQANQIAADETGDTTYEDIALGYYLMDSSLGTLCSLTTTDNVVEVVEKNSVPTVKKEVMEDSTSQFGESNTADIGQMVDFRSTITIPASTGDKSGIQNLVLHDKMDPVLALNTEKIVVDVDGTVLTKGTDYQFVTAELKDACTFEVVFAPTYLDSLSADEHIIKVSYSAVVTAEAETGKEYVNTTGITYGDNSESTWDSTTTETFDFNLKKVTSAGELLEGAEFELRRGPNATDTVITFVKVQAGYRVAVAGEADTTTTLMVGEANILGLDADVYYLHEIKAPDGYNKLADPVKVTIDEAGNVFMNDSEKAVEEDLIAVINQTGTELPSTGGMGTTIFYTVGGVLMAGAAILLITKKKMSAEE